MKLRLLCVLLGWAALAGCIEFQRTMRGEAAADKAEPDWGPVPINENASPEEGADVADGTDAQGAAPDDIGPQPPDESQQEDAQAEQAPDSPPELSSELPEITTETGLRYFDIEEGTGDTPASGDQIEADYTGWLEEDGTKFDSSVDRGQPFSFALGTGAVIAGWDEGFATMRVGGKRRLIIPPELAYGESGSGGIPPNATLIFDVELFSVSPP